MPNLKEIYSEVRDEALRELPNAYDTVRRRYIEKLHQLTGRNVIVYYSGWLQKADQFDGGLSGFEVNDSDQNGFMATIHKCDKSKGLDLVLHTPGGQVAATEGIINYLRSIFGTDIRAIIPQIALSAGTMIACGCKVIIMGKHSSIGPIDPQFGGLAAHAVIEEFERAKNEIAQNPSLAYLWQPILAQYRPTFIGACVQAIDWANSMVTGFLRTGMFEHESNAEELANQVVSKLGSPSETKTHSRHIPFAKAQEIGLKVEALEGNQELQEAVLSVHHACVSTLAYTNSVKIIENHLGTTLLTSMQVAT